MNNIVSFLLENKITITILFVVVVSLLVTWCFSKKWTNDKVGNEKRHQLSNKEYKTYREKSEKSIVNTTISFCATLCNDKNEMDDLYNRTVVVGNKILKEEEFRISSVRKV